MTPTICAKCKHIVKKEDRRPGTYWYNYSCGHPELEHPKGIDYVTGEPCYWTKNDLGQTYCTASPRPFCRDINDGECRYYEEAVI